MQKRVGSDGKMRNQKTGAFRCKRFGNGLSGKKVQDNLRDGLPFPYTEQDGKEYISLMLDADENATFAFAVTPGGKAIGCISVFRQGNIHKQNAELGYDIAEKYWERDYDRCSQTALRLCIHAYRYHPYLCRSVCL